MPHDQSELNTCCKACLYLCAYSAVTVHTFINFCLCDCFPPQSEQVSRLVKIPGIIISSSAVRAKATRVCLQCRGCRAVISNIPLPPGLQGYALPRKCNT